MRKNLGPPPDPFLVFFKKNLKNRPPPIIFTHPKSYFFGELKPHTKFKNPTITPSGRKVSVVEERKREKTPLIVDT